MDQLPFYQRPLRYTHVNVALILVVINVAVFLVRMIWPPSLALLGMQPELVLDQNWWWQPVTYMFMHLDTWHLVFNMIGLLVFGLQLERRLGSREFLLFYLLIGALSGFFSLLVYESVLGQSHLLVGASGAVFGLLLAFATYFPTATLLIFGIIPVRAPVLAVGYMALEVVNIITRVGGNVAHLTHLAGAVFAFVYLVVRLRINPIREFRDGGRY